MAATVIGSGPQAAAQVAFRYAEALYAEGVRRRRLPGGCDVTEDESLLAEAEALRDDPRYREVLTWLLTELRGMKSFIDTWGADVTKTADILGLTGKVATPTDLSEAAQRLKDDLETMRSVATKAAEEVAIRGRKLAESEKVKDEALEQLRRAREKIEAWSDAAASSDNLVDHLRATLLSLLAEIAPDAVVIKYMSCSYTAAAMIAELRAGTTAGDVYASDFLRVCRDFLARRKPSQIPEWRPLLPRPPIEVRTRP